MSNVVATSDRRAHRARPTRSDLRANQDPFPSAICVLPLGGVCDRAAAVPARPVPSAHAQSPGRPAAPPANPRLCPHAPPLELPPRRTAVAAAHPAEAKGPRCASAVFRENLRRSSPKLRRPEFVGNPQTMLRPLLRFSYLLTGPYDAAQS